MEEKIKRAIWGSPDKPLSIGNLEIQCYVLEDETRVLSGRGMQNALGLGQGHGAILKKFLGQKALIPFINSELAMALSNPIKFIRPGRGGKTALGYEATILPSICDAILEARDKGSLSENQLLVARQCEILTRSLAKVGIIALIDEVTGYQHVRDRLALEKILEAYITKELMKWQKRFPDEWYENLFKLRGIEWKGRSENPPQYVGKITRDIIYDRLPKGVREELEKLNPPNEETGRRKHKHHQFLTPNIGHPKLQEIITGTNTLMKISPNWRKFQEHLARAFPKHGEQQSIELEQ
jgi:hypothetical protein